MLRYESKRDLAIATDGDELCKKGMKRNQKEELLRQETSAAVSPSFLHSRTKSLEGRWEVSPRNRGRFEDHAENKEFDEQGPAVDDDINDGETESRRSRESCLLHLPQKMPTTMALETHREVVTDVQDFVVSPVPIQLGTLQCEVSNYEIEDEGLFSNAVKVWELRISDRRVKYDGLARFTNVNDTEGTGGGLNGPKLSDLQRERLVLVAEKRTRGFISKTCSYVFGMAPCDSYHNRVAVERPSHLIGKLEGTNCWGTVFDGFHFAKKFKNRASLIPAKQESLFVKYECSLGNPRQLAVSIPAVHAKGLDAITQAKLAKNALRQEVDSRDEDEYPDEKQGNAKRMPGAKSLSRDVDFWKNDIPPVADPDLGDSIKVIPEHEGKPSLEKCMQEFDMEKCLCFHNRKPVWDQTLRTHILDFGGRVTRASVKNFQLDLSEIEEQSKFVNYNSENGQVYTYQAENVFSRAPVVQFGECEPTRKGETRYTLDVRYPFSVIQAFQLALTSIENKQMFY